MKENYRAWDINLDVFPEEGSIEEQLKFLVRFAILAPSGHNSQPWEFEIENNILSLLINKERSLKQSDPDGRQLLISIGCALENLLIAADFYGFKTDIQYFLKVDAPFLLAKVAFKKTMEAKKDLNHLIFSIPRRRTNRNKYECKLLPKDFLETITQFSSEDFQVNIVTDKSEKEAIANVVIAAQIEAMDNNSFREELSHYVKSNFTREKVGMPGFTLGLPALISLIASQLIKRVNLSRKTKKQDESLLKVFTPTFVILSVRKDDKINWLKAGRLFEKIWLMAEREELSCSPLAAAIQVPDYYQQFQCILNITYRPIVFFRIGYCYKRPSHSPRLGIQEVLKI